MALDEIEFHRAGIVLREEINKLDNSSVQDVLNQLLDLIKSVHENLLELVAEAEDE